MATMDPALALSTCETAVRELMTFAYANAFGDDWVIRVAGDEERQGWQDLADVEQRTRGTKGVAAVPAAGLSYAHFYDLVTIAYKHWAPLAPALGERARVWPLLKRMDDLRNSIGHSRPMIAFERDLMSGIAGQIRNQVTIYMSTHDDAGDIYPRIESITDSFGHRLESTVANHREAGHVSDLAITLHPGDTITFDCVGVDPQDRELSWYIDYPARGTAHHGPSGSSVQLSYSLSDDDVTEQFMLGIALTTQDSQFHRYGKVDHTAYFDYRVRPPLSESD